MEVNVKNDAMKWIFRSLRILLLFCWSFLRWGHGGIAH